MNEERQDYKAFLDSEVDQIHKKISEKSKREPSVKPKQRKPSSYMLWSIEERKKISKEGVFSGSDIMKILGSRWKKLDEEEKQKWMRIAEKLPDPEEEKVVVKEKRPMRKVREEKEKNKKGKYKK